MHLNELIGLIYPQTVACFYVRQHPAVLCGFPTDVLCVVECLTKPRSLLLLLPPSSLDGRADLLDTEQEIKNNASSIRSIRWGVRAVRLTWILIWTLMSGSRWSLPKKKKPGKCYRYEMQSCCNGCDHTLWVLLRWPEVLSDCQHRQGINQIIFDWETYICSKRLEIQAESGSNAAELKVKQLQALAIVYFCCRNQMTSFM